jgi:hypothetical protein
MRDGAPSPFLSRRWRLAAAGLSSAALFLALTVPTIPHGAVTGTGQDEWYNMIRALKALYERFDPSYFIHPALFYEVLASLYGAVRLGLEATGVAATGVGFLSYVLAHEAQFLVLARWVSVAGGTVAVLATVWLASSLSQVSGGLLAGLLIATLPLLQSLSTAIRVDALALAALLVAATLVVRHHRSPTRRSLWLAAAGIGIAAAANYPGALLLLPLAWLELTRPAPEGLLPRARRLAAAGGFAFAVFLLLNPYVLIDLPQFLTWFAFQVRVAFATHPHGAEPLPTHYLALLREQGFPAVAACVAGIAATARPRKASGALAAYGLLYLAAFSFMRSQYDRFALPAIALLCVTGAAWLSAQLANRIHARATSVFVAVATPLIVWSAVAHRPPVGEPGEADYRAAMFQWIAQHVAPTATLVFESDTLPLLQTVYDPGVEGQPFQLALRAAFERSYPRLPARIIKAQFIGAVYNYDPKLLAGGKTFFLSSSQNRDYIAAHRAELKEPAAFYDALDGAAKVVYETGGFHEKLALYEVGE